MLAVGSTMKSLARELQHNVVMAASILPRVSYEEYLEIDRASETGNEFIFGELAPRIAASYAHGVIQANACVVLASRLVNSPCRTLAASVRVLLYRGKLTSYPDALVVCGKPELVDDGDTLTNPKLVVEVLSPSTRNYDLGDKTRMYLQIPSMTELLLIEQDKVWIEYWSREPGGEWLRKVYTSMADILKIKSLECELPVAGIYAGVELPGA
jgi:Uma2 family endonuclease